MEKGSSESRRIHLDWWGKCRTCTSWTGDREKTSPGQCLNSKSDLYKELTWTEGHCKKWDSFDVDTALSVLEEP